MLRTNWLHRARGATLALLVQALFLLLLVTTRNTNIAPHRVTPETLLFLRALPKPLPPPPATAPSRAVRPALPLIIPDVPSAAPAPLAPPSGITGFGRSLFGCAPEHYADLPPDEKAHCPKPGEGMAVNQPPDLLNPPKSRAKDEALWLEERREANWNTECTGAIEVAKCMMHQGMAEHRRALAARQAIADDKAARIQAPKPPLPNIGVRRN
jgi:hypothetical protein